MMTGELITNSITPYVIIPKWVLQKASKDAGFLYGVLAMYANSETAQCYPSVATILKATGFSRPHYYKMRDELVKIGAIAVTKRYREHGGQTSSLFTLAFAPPSQPDLPPPSQPDLPLTIQKELSELFEQLRNVIVQCPHYTSFRSTPQRLAQAGKLLKLLQSPENVLDLAQRFVDYCEGKPKKYKEPLLTMLAWERRNTKTTVEQSSTAEQYYIDLLNQNGVADEQQ